MRRSESSRIEKTARRQRLWITLLMGVLCLFLTACSGNSGNDSAGNQGGDGDNPQAVTGEPGTEKTKKNRAFFDYFMCSAMVTETFAFLPARNGGGARYFDVASRTDVLFCFEPNCEHQGWKLDPWKNTWYGDHCAAHSLGNDAFYLTDECGYYFDWPNLIRTDRQGLNQKTIGKVDEPLDFQIFELYTDEYYCSAFTIAYEHTQVTEPSGEVTWRMGERLEKEVAGIVVVSLTDGSSRIIFRDGEHYNERVTDLYEYEGHLYFNEFYIDVPFESLRQCNDDRSDWQEVDLENRKYQHVVLYDYDFASGELRKIFQRDGDGHGFRFGDGYILQQSDNITGEDAKLYRMDGELICDLPWAVSDCVMTDGTPILSSWDSGVAKYRMYDIEKGEVLREVDVPDGSFGLRTAVGDSYYGMVAGNWSDGTHAAYIAAEDFWSGAFDRAVVFHVGPEEE